MSDGNLYPAAAIGYRAFRLTAGRLMSASMSGCWEPGVNRAVCQGYVLRSGRQTHPAPDASCACGFYALHNARDIEAGRGHILAAVAARGALRVHHRGFRAAEARVVALLRPRRLLARIGARLAAKRYCVPLVRSVEELVAIASAAGIPVPISERPVLPAPMDRVPYWFGDESAAVWFLVIWAAGTFAAMVPVGLSLLIGSILFGNGHIGELELLIGSIATGIGVLIAGVIAWCVVRIKGI